MRTKYKGKDKYYPYRIAFITFTEKEASAFGMVAESLEAKGFTVDIMGECACINVASNKEYKEVFLPAWKEAKRKVTK